MLRVLLATAVNNFNGMINTSGFIGTSRAFCHKLSECIVYCYQIQDLKKVPLILETLPQQAKTPTGCEDLQAHFVYSPALFDSRAYG